MKKFLASAALVAATALAACTNPNTTRIDSRSINSSYDIDGLKWSNNGSFLALIFKLSDEAGKVGICGAYTFDKDLRGGPDSANELALNAMRLDLDGETLLNDLTFFNRVTYPESGFPKGTANCLVTDRPWKAEYRKKGQAELAISRTRFTVYE